MRNKDKRSLSPSQPSMTFMVWNIPVGQLGLSVWQCSLPAPAHLLINWTWETGKSPWFCSNKWKHQCYQHSSPTKPQTEQLLRKIIPAKTRTISFQIFHSV